MPDFSFKTNSDDQSGLTGCLTLVQWVLSIFLGLVFLGALKKGGGFFLFVFGILIIWGINSFFNNIKKNSGKSLASLPADLVIEVEKQVETQLQTQVLEQLQNREPGGVAGLFARGIADQEKENDYDALKSFNRILELDPNYADAWLHKGQVLQRMGRAQEASDAFFQYYNLSGQIKQD